MTDQEITRATERAGQYAAGMIATNLAPWLTALDRKIALEGKRELTACLKITLSKTEAGTLMISVLAPALKIDATLADQGDVTPLLGTDPAARLPGMDADLRGTGG